MQKVLEVAVILSAVDRMTSIVNRATNNAATKFASLQKQTEAVSRSAYGVGRDLGAMGLAAGAALAYPIKAAADFETGLSNVRKVTEGLESATALADMGRQVRQLSTELPIAQSELLELVAAGGRMGVPRAELIDYTRLVAKMASAFDAPAAQIGEDMGKLATVFNIPIAKIDALADAVNYLDDNAIAKGPEIIDVMRRVAGTAQQVGLAAPNVGALASTFLTLGATAEKAGTASNALLRELSLATIQPARFQDGLARLGLKAAEIKEQMSINPQNTILGVLDKINALPKANQVEVTTQLFGKEYGDDIAKLSQGMGEYRRQLALLNDPKLNGSVQREFAIRVQTTNAQLQLAKNQAAGVAVVIGSALLPAVNRALTAARPYINQLAEWAEKNQTLVGYIGMAVAAFAALSLAGSGISFLVGGIAKAVSLASGAFGFLSKAIGVVGRAVAIVGRIFLANPILLVIALIAGAVYLIYKNWDTIGPWFRDMWAKVKTIFSAAWEWVKSFFLNYTPQGLIIKHWGDITGVLSRFYEAGKNIMLSLWNGIKSLAMKPVDAIKDVVGKMRDYLPFSPAKVGPFRDLHRVKIVETIASAIKPAPLVAAMQGVTRSASRQGFDSGFGGGGGSLGGGVVINFSPSITVGGTGGQAAKDDILAALRQYKGELARLVDDALQQRKRAAF